MKLNFSSAAPQYFEQTKSMPTVQSRANQHSTNFAQEKNINKLEHQNLVNNYFQIFDQSYSEVTIKNLISARLQPSIELPRVHNTEYLSSKSEELLEFSLAI